MNDVISILKKLINYKSITPESNGIYEYIKSELNSYSVIEQNSNNVSNIFLYKKGRGKHLCLAGHVDTVPVGGDNWKYSPFTAVEDSGYIYGRGAQDMKSGVASYIYALKELTKFNGTISLLLTSDEEGDALYGTKSMLELLEKKDMLPDYTIITEPCSEIEFGDIVKIGRRGSISGTITIYGKQGHVAYPNKCDNPVNSLAKILDKLANHSLDGGNVNYEPSKIVITDIRGGYEVTNVTPDEVKLMFNVRNNIQTNSEDIVNYIDSICNDMEYSLDIKVGSNPFITSRNDPFINKVCKIMKEVNNIEPKLETGGGTSDARFFAKYGIPTVEFGVLNDRIHAVDERVDIHSLKQLAKVICKLLTNF